MMNRTAGKEVSFDRPFQLAGLDGIQPADTHVIETGEELLQAPSFPVWRRLGTVIDLPRKAGGPMVDQVATVNPAALEAALALDAADRSLRWRAPVF